MSVPSSPVEKAPPVPSVSSTIEHAEAVTPHARVHKRRVLNASSDDTTETQKKDRPSPAEEHAEADTPSPPARVQKRRGPNASSDDPTTAQKKERPSPAEEHAEADTPPARALKRRGPNASSDDPITTQKKDRLSPAEGQLTISGVELTFKPHSKNVHSIIVPDTRLQMTRQEREIVANEVLSMCEVPPGKKKAAHTINSASKSLESVLKEHYSGVSQRTIRGWASVIGEINAGKGTSRLPSGVGSKGGRSRLISTSSLGGINQKLHDHDRNTPISRLQTYLCDARQKTSKENQTASSSLPLSETTKRRYTAAVLVNTTGTKKPDWDTNARRSASDSVRNSVSNAAMCDALIHGEMPEFGVTQEQAKESPVHPDCCSNADPTTVNINTDESQSELMIRHVNSDYKDRMDGGEKAGGSAGGGANTQSAKVRE